MPWEGEVSFQFLTDLPGIEQVQVKALARTPSWVQIIALQLTSCMYACTRHESSLWLSFLT